MTSVQKQVNFLIAEDPHSTCQELYTLLNATTQKEKWTIQKAKQRALKNHPTIKYHPKTKKVILNVDPISFDDVVKNGYPTYKSLYKWQWDLYKAVEVSNLLLIIVPRDHGKSIFLTYYIEYLLHVKKMDVLLLGWTDRVKQMAMYIYSYFLRNSIVIDEQVVRNTMNHFMTYDGIRFDCYGLKEKAILGFHPEEYDNKNGMVLIIDDPIDESFENYPAKERDVEARWESTISNINPTKLIISGTRKFEGDFLEYIAKNYEGKITVYHKTPYNEDGSLLCPERWTSEKLLEKKAEIGEYRFSSEYMGNPEPITGGVWIETDLHYASKIKEWSEYDSCMISVDPSWTQEAESDFTAIIVMFRERQTKKYIVFTAMIDLMTFDKILNTIESLFRDIRNKFSNIPISIAIEANGGGILLINLAKAAIGFSFRNYILEVTHSRAKQERIMVLEMPIKNGSVMFMEDLKKSELIREILTYPNCRKLDAIDALAMGYTELELKYNKEFTFRRGAWY